MASSEETVDVEVGKVEEAPPAPAPEVAEAVEEAPPKAEGEAPPPSPPLNKCVLVDGILRALVFSAALAALVVIATSNQTEIVPGQGPVEAKFTQSPALIYFVVAWSVAGFYFLITGLESLISLYKPLLPKIVRLYVFIADVLLLGIVTAAMGTAGAVAYIELKGNSHVNWGKICGIYDKFCDYLAASLALSLFGSIIIVFIIVLSIVSLYKK